MYLLLTQKNNRRKTEIGKTQHSRRFLHGETAIFAASPYFLFWKILQTKKPVLRSSCYLFCSYPASVLGQTREPHHLCSYVGAFVGYCRLKDRFIIPCSQIS